MCQKNSRLILIVFVVFMMFYILMAPEICIEGAKNGLLLWFNKILPSLLPFIILTNILSQMGIVFKLSQLATPLTNFFFKLPGVSFFVFVMGFIAGYPTGAKLTKQLLDNKQLSINEAQKTLCFCNNCGPLFIIGTVGTVMLGRPEIGYFLVGIHFLSALMVGIIFRFYPTQPKLSLQSKFTTSQVPLTSFYSIFNLSIQNAMDTIVYVGGYIIFFSVIASIIKSSSLVYSVLSRLDNAFHIPDTLTLSGIIGSLEFSNGISFLCAHSNFSIYSLALISSIIGFGGFCVYFQSSYFLQDSPLSMRLYLFSKFIQAILSFILTSIFYPLFFMYTAKPYFYFRTIGIFLLIIVLSFLILKIKFHITSYPKSHTK